MFSYLNFRTKDCEGWLNLFFDGQCIAVIQDVALANKIREVTVELRITSVGG